MTRIAAVALLAAAACGGRADGSAQRFDGEAALARVRHQVDAGPRVPGTPGHRAVGLWIEAEARRFADTVEVQSFTHVTQAGDTLPLRNIVARFRPRAPDRILFLAHWDTKPAANLDLDPARRRLPVPGANDGASGVAVLLGVAEALRREPPAVGVDLLFVDGEDYGEFEGDAPDNLLGSRHFARTMPADYRPLFAVVFDMVGDRDLRIDQEGYSLDRAPEVVERVWTRAEEIGLGRIFRPRRGQYITDDHVPLLQAGIRAIDLIDLDYPPWHTTEDTTDKVSAESLAAVGRLALALLR